MKRFIVSMMVVVGALLSACTEEEEIFELARLAGTYDVALVGDLLFVTSTDNDELRVLELAESQRRFVRAPNPIEPLAIPVLSRPQTLTRDVRYVNRADDEDPSPDVEEPGSYVYARSSGTTEISVVGADINRLVELRRLDTRALTQHLEPSLRSSGPVTAFAALALPGVEGQEGGSTLYYATQEVSGARLWQVQLPGPAQLDANTPLSAEPLAVPLSPNEAVSAILVMPQPGLLAVATRGSAGVSGRSFTVDLNNNNATRTLNFGAQVLRLVTHERVDYVEPEWNTATGQFQDASRTLKAGARIFGVLDASGCGVVAQCTGVLAVETDTGEVANDASGRDPLGNIARIYDMLPITSGAGLPMGLSLSTNTNLTVSGGEKRSLAVPLLGIIPLSNGEILFFDALNLQHLNVGASWEADEQENTATAEISYFSAQGTTQTNSTDISFEGTFGVTPDQTYQLTYEGILPGMSSLSRSPGTSTFEVPFVPNPADPAMEVVRPGDFILLFPEGEGVQPCAVPDGDLQVLEVQARPGDRAVLVPDRAIPPECADYPRFQVRAGGSKRLVLSDSNGSYLQRLGPGDEYSVEGPFFFHPPGFPGANTDTSVDIRVLRLAENIARGAFYVVATESHFFPYVLTVDTVIYEYQRELFRLPGPVVRARVGGTDYAYIVYPSANGILEMNLTGITAGVANTRGIFTYQ